MARLVELSIEKIEEMAGLLSQIDSNKTDQIINQREFQEALNNFSDSYMKKLVGASRDYSTWDKFKISFKEFQAQYGFYWKDSPGPNTPIRLDTIELDERVGEIIAKKLFKNKRIVLNNEDGYNIYNEIKDFFPVLNEYLSDNFSEIIELENFKKGFTEYSENNASFKFKKGRGGTKFKKILKEYTFKTNGKQNEEELGLAIYDHLSKLFRLEDSKDNQNSALRDAGSERKGGQLENVDFVSYRINRKLNSDEIEIFTFELKANNEMESISKAISQANSYKIFSNYVYIIIPFFDRDTFHNSDRFDHFYELCKNNKIGILSVDCDFSDDKNHSVKDVYEVLTAQRVEIIDFRYAKRKLEDYKLLICPLCNMIVDEPRTNCGWFVQNTCMKNLFEEKLNKI